MFHWCLCNCICCFSCNTTKSSGRWFLSTVCIYHLKSCRSAQFCVVILANSFSVTFQFVFPGYHFWLQFLLKCLRCAGCSWRWRKINRSCSWRCFYRFRKWQIKWYEVVIQYVVDRLRNMMEITWYGWHILKWPLDILDKLPS